MRRRLPLAAAFVVPFVAFTQAASAVADASSPFLRGHADSAIDWMPWGEAAFARARAEQKPIYLCVGLATSELSRAMTRQTFSNADTAAFLNQNFICVLADANEQPQLTALYQNYLQTLKQLRGLPLNLWLTPELKPFEGANYLPPTEEWGKEGFLTVARRAAAGWQADPAAQRAKADEAVATVGTARRTDAPPALTTADAARTLAAGFEAWQALHDSANGGFGEPPKQLEPELLRALLRHPAARDLALDTLRAILRGAVRDPLDGGFFRYASDAAWQLPYFQKNLIDQARMAIVLLDAARTSGEAGFADAARDALYFVLDSLRIDAGGYAAVLDATAETQTAAHLWTRDEIASALGPKDADAFCGAFGITAEGNLAADALPGIETGGRNLPFLADSTAAKGFTGARAKLLKLRRERAAPTRDENATAAAHGLLLAAFARAGAELPDARLASAAQDQFAFVRTRLLRQDGALLHLATLATPATALDHALMIEGLLTLQSSANRAEAGQLARQLLGVLNTTFLDAAAGRYFAVFEDPAAGLWARVHTPPAANGEPPAAEPMVVLASSTHSLEAHADLLARAIAVDVDESAEAPRGDFLLALQARQRELK